MSSPPAHRKSPLHFNNLIIWITLTHVFHYQPPKLVFIVPCPAEYPTGQKDFRSVIHRYSTGNSSGSSCVSCGSTSIGSGNSKYDSSSGVVSLIDRAIPSSYCTASCISTLIGSYFHMCLMTVLLAISS